MKSGKKLKAVRKLRGLSGVADPLDYQADVRRASPVYSSAEPRSAIAQRSHTMPS